MSIVSWTDYYEFVISNKFKDFILLQTSIQQVPIASRSWYRTYWVYKENTVVGRDFTTEQQSPCVTDDVRVRSVETCFVLFLQYHRSWYGWKKKKKLALSFYKDFRGHRKRNTRLSRLSVSVWTNVRSTSVLTVLVTHGHREGHSGGPVVVVVVDPWTMCTFKSEGR